MFPLLSVEDNLRMGAYTRRDADGVGRDVAGVFNYFPVLRERARQEAGQLVITSCSIHYTKLYE